MHDWEKYLVLHVTVDVFMVLISTVLRCTSIIPVIEIILDEF